jgi:hypothetical protein
MTAWMRTHVLPGAGKVVYGSIVALTLILVLDFDDAKAGAAVLSLVAALIAVGFAEAYADFLEEMLRHRRTLHGRERLTILEGVALHLLPALAPISFFVLAAIRAIGLETAYGLAEWTGVAILGLFAFGAYRAAGGTILHSLLAGAGLTAVGLAVVIVKLFADH